MGPLHSKLLISTVLHLIKHVHICVGNNTSCMNEEIILTHNTGRPAHWSSYQATWVRQPQRSDTELPSVPCLQTHGAVPPTHRRHSRQTLTNMHTLIDCETTAERGPGHVSPHFFDWGGTQCCLPLTFSCVNIFTVDLLDLIGWKAVKSTTVKCKMPKLGQMFTRLPFQLQGASPLLTPSVLGSSFHPQL